MTRRDKIIWLAILAAALATAVLTAAPSNIDLLYPRPITFRTTEVKPGDRFTNAPALATSDMLPVVPGPTNSATLLWDASPSASTNIAGYKILQGSASNNWNKTWVVGNFLTTTITGLYGQNYFACMAYDTNGLDSDLSNILPFTASPAPDTIVIEAETATLTAPMQTGTSNGVTFIFSPVINGSGSAVYAIPSLPDGTYNVFGYALCDDGGSDSFWASMDGIAATSFPMSTNYGSWQWGKGLSFSLLAGTHTLMLTPREINARLDKLCLTTKTNPPATGTNYMDLLFVSRADFGTTNWVRVTNIGLTVPGLYRVDGVKTPVP